MAVLAFTFEALKLTVLLLLYNIFVFLYGAALRLAANWNTKAARWVHGRRDGINRLNAEIPDGSSIVWMHCASAGEFEQGKPLLEEIRKKYPGFRILVSFFSPSGYQSGKKYKGADHICYLPEDKPDAANDFISAVRPAIGIIVKYDYWYHHLRAARNAGVPLILVSAIFREDQVFFKWYGGLHRKMLGYFTHLFVQDSGSQERLRQINIEHVTVAGDTRFDRVAHIASQAQEVPEIAAFAGSEKVLVAGSTWPDDEKLIAHAIHGSHLKTIIAPHEINSKHLSELKGIFPDAVLFSEYKAEIDQNILIIDNYGMLSKLYRYAHITYIGGGFNKSGIHNTLEAAVWCKPVIFGPNYEKFREAKALVAGGAAFSVKEPHDLHTLLRQLLHDPDKLHISGKNAGEYVRNNEGATKKILAHIAENRLLTT